MRIDLNCPAEVVSTELIREAESWVRLILMDLSDLGIDSCEATVRLLDREGEETGRTVHRARSLRGRPHSAFTMMVPVELPAEAVPSMTGGTSEGSAEPVIPATASSRAFTFSRSQSRFSS